MKHRYLRETLCTSGRARGMAALWREGKGPLGAQAQRGFARGPTSPASGRVPFSPLCPRPSLCISQDLMTVSHLSLRLLFCGCQVGPPLKGCPQFYSLMSQSKRDQPQHSACDVSRAKACHWTCCSADAFCLFRGCSLLQSLCPRRQICRRTCGHLQRT